MDIVRIAGSEDTQTGTVVKSEIQPSAKTVVPAVKKKRRKHRSTQLVKEIKAPPEGEQEEKIMDWPEGGHFKALPKEVTHAREAPLYNKLPENEKRYALFIDGTCHTVGERRKWKAAVWSPTRKVTETIEGKGGCSEFAELQAILQALHIAEREKWPVLYLYTDSQRVVNGLWGWLQRQKLDNSQWRGKPIWYAGLWQDIAARIKNLVVKVSYVDKHTPKSRDSKEHGKKEQEQTDQPAEIVMAGLSKIDLNWDLKGEMFLAQWAHDASGHQGRDATCRWACGRGLDLSIEAVEEAIRQCEICATIKQMKPFPCGEKWLGKTVWVAPSSGEGTSIRGVPFAQNVEGTGLLVMLEDGETRCVPEGRLSLAENDP